VWCVVWQKKKEMQCGGVQRSYVGQAVCGVQGSVVVCVCEQQSRCYAVVESSVAGERHGQG